MSQSTWMGMRIVINDAVPEGQVIMSDALNTATMTRATFAGHKKRMAIADVLKARINDTVSEQTLQTWRVNGLSPEPGSPLHRLMIVYDDTSNKPRRELLLKAAMQIHKLTPFASCRHES